RHIHSLRPRASSEFNDFADSPENNDYDGCRHEQRLPKICVDFAAAARRFCREQASGFERSIIAMNTDVVQLPFGTAAQFRWDSPMGSECCAAANYLELRRSHWRRPSPASSLAPVAAVGRLLTFVRACLPPAKRIQPESRPVNILTIAKQHSTRPQR